MSQLSLKIYLLLYPQSINICHALKYYYTCKKPFFKKLHIFLLILYVMILRYNIFTNILKNSPVSHDKSTCQNFQNNCVSRFQLLLFPNKLQFFPNELLRKYFTKVESPYHHIKVSSTHKIPATAFHLFI